MTVVNIIIIVMMTDRLLLTQLGCFISCTLFLFFLITFLKFNIFEYTSSCWTHIVFYKLGFFRSYGFFRIPVNHNDSRLRTFLKPYMEKNPYSPSAFGIADVLLLLHRSLKNTRTPEI